MASLPKRTMSIPYKNRTPGNGPAGVTFQGGAQACSRPGKRSRNGSCPAHGNGPAATFQGEALTRQYSITITPEGGAASHGTTTRQTEDPCWESVTDETEMVFLQPAERMMGVTI